LASQQIDNEVGFYFPSDILAGKNSNIVNYKNQFIRLKGSVVFAPVRVFDGAINNENKAPAGISPTRNVFQVLFGGKQTMAAARFFFGIHLGRSF
jgi:hypothetical protein